MLPIAPLANATLFIYSRKSDICCMLRNMKSESYSNMSQTLFLSPPNLTINPLILTKLSPSNLIHTGSVMVKSVSECLRETEVEKLGREDGGRMGRGAEQTQGYLSLHLQKSDSTCVASFLLGYICVGFTLCSSPVRLPGSGSDGPVSLGLQPHRKDPCGLSVRRAGTKVRLRFR